MHYHDTEIDVQEAYDRDFNPGMEITLSKADRGRCRFTSK